MKTKMFLLCTCIIALAVISISGLVLPTPASADTISLVGTIRDFNDTHPDFEDGISGVVTGIVQSTLGVDGKPVYDGCGEPIVAQRMARQRLTSGIEMLRASI